MISLDTDIAGALRTKARRERILKGEEKPRFLFDQYRYGGVASDPNCLSLNHFNGANGATAITDEKAISWTRIGTATLSTTQIKFGTTSTSLNGSGSYWSATSALFAFGTGDFTYEGWFYLTNHTDRMLFGYASSNANGWGILADAGSQRRPYFGTGLPAGTVAGAFPLNSWTHIALTRASGTVRMFQAGALILTAAGMTQNVTATNFFIGAGLYNSFLGFIDEFRISNIARYTAAFTPSAVEFTP